MKKAVVFLILVSTMLNVACTDRDDNLDVVNIRIKNVSAYIFDEVQVGAAETIHENIAPNEFSEYLEYEIAYDYAYIQIKSGTETWTLQPIDFVGETPLSIGFYTYELNVDEVGSIHINLVSDL